MRYEIIVDHGETANKCTIMPLSHRPDFTVRRFPRGQPIAAMGANVLLHPEGQSIHDLRVSTAGAEFTIGAVDCVWRRLDPIVKWLEKPLPPLVKIPDGFVTAYPRQSKFSFDPTGGLATIEALFIAAALLGHWDLSLFSEYFFGDRFLALNTVRFAHYGIDIMALAPTTTPTRKPLTSAQRRIARGRGGVVI